MPRAVVVTHIDQPRGDFAAAVENCQLVFGDGVHPLYLPVDRHAAGRPDRADRPALAEPSSTPAPAPGWPDRPTTTEADAIAGQRDALIEAVITESEDDGLLDRYLAGEEVGFDTVVDDLETAVARGAFHPVLPASRPPDSASPSCSR